MSRRPARSPWPEASNPRRSPLQRRKNLRPDGTGALREKGREGLLRGRAADTAERPGGHRLHPLVALPAEGLRQMRNIGLIQRVSHRPGRVHLPPPQVRVGHVEHVRPDLFGEPGLVHAEKLFQPEVFDHRRRFFVHLEFPGEPGGVPGADALAAVAPVDAEPHRLPKLRRGQLTAEIGEVGDAAARIDPARPRKRPRRTGGNAGVLAPVGAADLDGRLVRFKFLVDDERDRKDPRPERRHLPGIEEAVLAERPQAGPRRRHPVGAGGRGPSN